MKEPYKTYEGAAVFFERLADDGWPEDGGLWPIGGWPSPSKNLHGRFQMITCLSESIKSLFAGRNRPSQSSLAGHFGHAIRAEKGTN